MMEKGLLAFVVVFLLMGCSQSTDPTQTASPLEIHLVSGFSDNRVVVVLDGEEVFDKVISSDPVITLADRIVTTVRNGTHELVVEVDGFLRDTRQFTVDGRLYVLVDKLAGREPYLGFTFRSEPPGYR